MVLFTRMCGYNRILALYGLALGAGLFLDGYCHAGDVA